MPAGSEIIQSLWRTPSIPSKSRIDDLDASRSMRLRWPSSARNPSATGLEANRAMRKKAARSSTRSSIVPSWPMTRPR